MTAMEARLIVVLFFLLSANIGLRAQGTAFTYQGRLNDGGRPATGIYDLRFVIYDSTNQPGNAIAGPLTNSATAVINGLFAVKLDFGTGVFTGNPCFLDISVRTNGSTNAFTILSPRQPLTPTPYAIFANTASNVSGSLSAAQLTGTLPASAFTGYSNTVAQIATAIAQAVVATNLTISALASSPENLGTGRLPFFYGKLMSHYPVKILWLGDSVSEDTCYSVLKTLSGYMPTNGAQINAAKLAFGPNSYFYYGGTAAGSVNHAIFPVNQFVMTNGQSLQVWSTLVFPGYNANTVELYYWASNNFGTITVQTNVGAGPYATLAVVNANNSGIRTAMFTNWFFRSQQHLNVQLLSTGNNLILGASIWNTNQNKGFVQSWMGQGGLDLGDWVASPSAPSVDGFTTTSNDFRTIIQGMVPDLIVVEVEDGQFIGDYHIQQTLSNFVNCVRSSSASNCDIVFVNPQPGNPDNGGDDWQRQIVYPAALGLGIELFDAYSLFPTNGALAFFYADNTHLNTNGMQYVGASFAKWLDLVQVLPSFGYPPQF